MNWRSKRYFVTLRFPLFHSCKLLQIRLPWNKLIHNGARNINSSYMDNVCKEITCTSMEKINSRQFIIVITIIIPISVVHLPNEINQNNSQYPNWWSNYKLPEFNLTLNLSPAFHTIFYSLVPLNQLLSLACANPNFWSSPKNSKICLSLSLPLALSVTLQFILNQYALILSKQTLIS